MAWSRDRYAVPVSAREARAIYEKDFWEAVGCPDLPARLAFAVFDAAVNNGVGRAVHWLQRAVGAEQTGEML
jgi:lysozyme family protein